MDCKAREWWLPLASASIKAYFLTAMKAYRIWAAIKTGRSDMGPKGLSPNGANPNGVAKEVGSHAERRHAGRDSGDVEPTRTPWPPLPARAHRWNATPRDAVLGAGLVGSLPLIVLCTFWLHPLTGTIAGALAVEVGASLIALALVFLPWARLPASSLLVFPGILAGALIAAAGLDRSFTASYVGFITLSFLYIGLTQSRLVPFLALPIAIPIYFYCEHHVTPAIDVRLRLPP